MIFLLWWIGLIPLAAFSAWPMIWLVKRNENGPITLVLGFIGTILLFGFLAASWLKLMISMQ